jgi:3-oxoacyl-[acyl-carrier-protein] synthase II
MIAYIKAATALSPQKTFGEQGFPAEITSFKNVNFLKCIEPVYSEYIDPMVSRRMSRIIKMSVCTALKCLRDSAVNMPDAIITGTALGCIEDTEKFLGSIYTCEEKLLNPTPFIQSTHNTVAGAIALALKCNNYNTTYAHRGFSFESALLDTMLLLSENPDFKILTGSFDELTNNSYEITCRLGMWKNHPVNSADLMRYSNRGSLPGEGVAFFVLGGTGEPGDLAALKAVSTFYKPKDDKAAAQTICNFLEKNGLSPDDVDLVLYGINGDCRHDKVYYHLMQNTFAGQSAAWFKHLCGEYDTASSFALWMAAIILRDQKVPPGIVTGDKVTGKINRMLIYNHVRGNNHALYLLERC